jgi:toxin ParE1/3/4
MGHILSPQADSDLDSIWYYAASGSGSVEIADRLIDSIAERFFLLSKYPNVGRRRDDDLRPGLRSFPTGEYIIIYRLRDDDVLILRVLRGARNLHSLVGR